MQIINNFHKAVETEQIVLDTRRLLHLMHAGTLPKMIGNNRQADPNSFIA